MDNGSIIGIVGLITAVFTGLGLLLKHIKHSECMRGCCEIDTRSPTRQDSVISPPAPPPTPTHKRKRHNAESEDTEDKHEDKKSEFNLDIIDSSV